MTLAEQGRDRPGRTGSVACGWRAVSPRAGRSGLWHVCRVPAGAQCVGCVPGSRPCVQPRGTQCGDVTRAAAGTRPAPRAG